MPVRSASTFEETVERLGTAIRTGIIPPDSQLPAERVLADELGISRSTLRQALTTLVQSGHLVSLRGRSGGTFVTERPPLESRLRPVTVLACERAEAEDLERLELVIERMWEVPDFDVYRRADIRFHIGLAEGAGSRRPSPGPRADGPIRDGRRGRRRGPVPRQRRIPATSP